MMKFNTFYRENMKKTHFLPHFGKICAFFLFILLTACTKTPAASDSITNSAINTTTALEQSLPAQCATDGIKTQINAIKTQINAIKTACDTEKQVITQEKIRWKWAFFGLLAVVVAYILRRLSVR